MKTQFRPTTPQDAPAVTELLQRIFHLREDAPLIARRHLAWKCWEDHPGWSGSRGYVMTAGERIVAHGTVVPLTCLGVNQGLRLVHLIDWAADPDSVGAGVRLLLQIAKLADGIVVAGGSDITQKVLPVIGFKDRGDVENYVRPLHPLSRLSGQSLNSRALAQTARGLLWRLQAPGVSTKGWVTTRIHPAQLETARIRWPLAQPGTALFQRSNGLAAYFLKCPAAPMEFYGVARDGRELGYFLLAQAPGQTRLVDFYVASEQPEAWSQVVQLAVNQARTSSSAAELAAVASEPVTRQALQACGFHLRGKIRLRLLLKKGLELPEPALRFQLLDSDAAYLHNNRPEYWA